MNQINRTFRNLAGLIILVVLAAAVFWLVSSQADSSSQLTAQSPDQADSPTVSTPPAAVTPEPTNPPFTPEEVIGKVTLITPPPPPPTIGPGPLSSYRLEEIKRLTVSGPKQTFLDGWTADSQNLFIYSIGEISDINIQSNGNESEQNTFVGLLPVNQNDSISIQDSNTNTLNARVGWHPDFISQPVKQLGNLEYFIYREYIANDQFELWLSSIDGKQKELLTRTNLPNFSPSIDGYLVYIKDNQLHLLQPTQTKDKIIATVSLDNVVLDVHDRLFDIRLSSGGKYAALYDSKGHLYTVDMQQQTITDLSLDEANTQVLDVAWSPNSHTLAYTEGYNPDQLSVSGPIMVLQEANGDGRQIVKYNSTFNDEPVGLYNIKWSPQGEFVLAIADPYQCLDCSDLLVLISSDGQNVAELVKMAVLGDVQWSPDGSKISYLCSDDPYQLAKICVSNIVK